MNARFSIPPITNEDKLPDDRAVWRSPPAPSGEGFRQITVQYGDSAKERTTVDDACWPRVQCWRWGWAPERRVA